MARELADPARADLDHSKEHELLCRAWALGILTRIERDSVEGLAERSEALTRFEPALHDEWTTALAVGVAASGIRYLASREERKGDARDLDAVCADLARAEEIFRRASDRRRASWVRIVRARTERLRGRNRVALDLLPTAIELAGDDANLQIEARGFRLAVLIALADFNDEQRDAPWLEAHLSEAEASALYSPTAAWHAVGTWHLRRLPEAQESKLDRLKRAEHAFLNSLTLSTHEFGEGIAREALALVRIGCGELAAARKDLDAARRCYFDSDRHADMRRCLITSAWLEHNAGRFADARELLREHRFQMEQSERAALDERIDHLTVLAFVACAEGARRDAITALEEVLELEDETIRSAAPGFEVLLAAEAVESHGYLVSLLCADALDPEARDKAFARAEAAIEHGRARLLRRALDARGAPVAEPNPRAIGKLHPLPKGLAHLRWFVARSPQVDFEHDRYVLLARAGERVVFEDLGPCAEIDAEIEQFLNRCMNPNGLGLGAEQYSNEATAVAQRVLGSTRAWFQDAELSIERTVLMTDGAIERLPFAALVLESAAPVTSYSQPAYLVRYTSLLRVPSLAILHSLPAPNDARNALALLCTADALPAVRAEGDALRAAIPGARVLSGEQASSAALLHAFDSARWGWLHLAAHADLDSTGSPQLRLHYDSLRFDMVEALPLTPGLRVVLSACGTASGDFHRGEGVFGLWRSFLLAGASSAIATLFAVDDRSAAAWMRSFYRAARDGQPIASAVRATQLDWLAGSGVPRYPRGSAVLDSAHPFLWASYVCVGRDGGVLPPTR